MYIKDSVIWKERSYGSLLFDAKSERIMKLNRMGTRIFLLHLNRRRSVDHIVKTLSYEYNMEKNQIKRDVEDFILSLKNSGMLTDDIIERGTINLLEIDPPLDSCTLVLTQRCNLQCKHCFVSGNRRTEELSTEDVKKIIDELSTFKIFDLVITGGEPLMRHDILDLLKYCDFKNVHVTLFTNGTLIDENFIENVKNLKILLRVSIDGATRETNDYIRGEGTFEKAISAVEKSVKAGIRTGMATTIYKGNFPECRKMVDLAKKLGCYKFEMSEIIPMGNAKGRPEFFLSQEEFEELRWYNLERFFDTPMIRSGKNMNRLVDNFFDAQDFKGRDMCTAGKSSCAISSEGDVYPCQLFMDFPEFYEGNIKKTSLEELWVNGFKKLRNLSAKDIKKCASCECLSTCAGGCRARAYAATGDLYAPMDEDYCKVTRSIWKRLTRNSACFK